MTKSPLFWFGVLAILGLAVFAFTQTGKKATPSTAANSVQSGALGAAITQGLSLLGSKLTAPSSSYPPNRNVDFTTAQLDSLRAADQAAGVEGPY